MGESNHRWKGGPQDGICAQCGDVFIAPRWLLKIKKFCSRECYGKSKIIKNRHRTRPHVLIAEKILGKRLPNIAVVHHVNQNKKDNRPSNLVICQDQSYHLLIHARQRIVDAGGNPKTDRICTKCKQIKSKTEFHNSSSSYDGCRCYCKPCQSKIYQERRYSNGSNSIEDRA